MIASVDVRASRPDIARRKFMAYTVLRFTVALAIGALIALLEHCSWLPCRMSQWIVISPPKHSFWMSITGPIILQTLPALLLMMAGLHRMGYPYTSRILYSLFWILHGIDVWNFLLLLSENRWSLWPVLIFMVLIVAVMGLVMLRIHSSATAGICYQFSDHTYGMTPVAYFLCAVRLWGALLILQFIFNVLYLSII